MKHKFTDNQIIEAKDFDYSKRLSGSSRFNFVDSEVVEKKKVLRNKKLSSLDEFFNLPNEIDNVDMNLLFQFAANKEDNTEEIKEDLKKENKNYKLNKKLIRQRLFSFFNLKESKEKLYFVTITFPEKMKDDLIYKYFNIWLTRIRSEMGINSYLWIIERQQNGTLHFHMFVNQYLSIRKANGFLRKTLINGIQNGDFIYSIDKVRNYNGVDLAKKMINGKRSTIVQNFAECKSKKPIKKYIMKYVTKNNTSFNRATWRASQSISVLFTSLTTDVTADILADILRTNKLKASFDNPYVSIFIFENELKASYFSLLFETNQLIFDSFS